MAPVGHAAAQAGKRLRASSVTDSSSMRARSKVTRMRCWQKVHFSTTPAGRSATSGFALLASPPGQAGAAQL
jgi:hypothetical protein